MHLQKCAELPLLGVLGQHSIRSDSSACFEFISRQMQICSDLHQGCRPAQHCRLPKRVLSLVDFDTSDISLIETYDQTGAYAALSHCWGAFQPLKILTTNLAKMKQGIPWKSLPCVFQDAARVCRRLGLKYIWIDSLCILQDSVEDWDIESSKMCQYYENAYITISATASPNSRVPFLKNRDKKWHTQSFQFHNSDGQTIDIIARQDCGASGEGHQEDPGVLGTRAWVMQETLLSRQILHFAESELVWECRSCILAEDGVRPIGLYSSRLPRLLLRCEEGADPYNTWHTLVSAYVLRHLTFESDRLPAISGAAAKFRSFTQSDYVAGLWANNLPLDLCWMVDYINESLDSEPKFSLSQYLAPTWAWPSVMAPVRFIDKDEDQPFVPLATILEVQCEKSGLNPYGPVSSGNLVLRGRMATIPVTCEDPKNFNAYTLACEEDPDQHIIPDTILVNRNGRLQKANETDELAPFSLEVSFVLLGRDEDVEIESSNFHALFLGEVGESRYCRLGYTSFPHDAYFAEALEETICIV